ncbi:Actin-binding LIM protein 3 [Papilio xuthus]|uniref:Actin-binding LIM protein 3 n=1 Tax=Papilio xuthus TaxID=66420 RepID=A0A0N0P9R4_PAPXU|nr:Actin-binding LIM protein 3 [Papilio xuthus]
MCRVLGAGEGGAGGGGGGRSSTLPPGARLAHLSQVTRGPVGPRFYNYLVVSSLRAAPRPGYGLAARSHTFSSSTAGDFTFSGLTAGDKTHSTDFSSGKSDMRTDLCGKCVPHHLPPPPSHHLPPPHLPDTLLTYIPLHTSLSIICQSVELDTITSHTFDIATLAQTSCSTSYRLELRRYTSLAYVQFIYFVRTCSPDSTALTSVARTPQHYLSAGSITDVDRSAVSTEGGVVVRGGSAAGGGAVLGGTGAGVGGAVSAMGGVGPRGGGVRRSLPNMATSHLLHEPAKLYPYHLLLITNYRLPPDVDRLNLERHLSDVEFEAILQVTRAEFYRLPQWRRNELKRRARLF